MYSCGKILQHGTVLPKSSESQGMTALRALLLGVCVLATLPDGEPKWFHSYAVKYSTSNTNCFHPNLLQNITLRLLYWKLHQTKYLFSKVLGG